MFAQLGTTVFQGLLGPSDMRTTEAVKFPQIELVEGKPRLQRLGSELITMQLSIKLNNAFCDPDGERNKLASAMQTGAPLPYLRGDGVYLGDFVIESIDTNITQTTATGTTVECELSLDLVEYVEPDPGLANRMAAASRGFGMLANKPAPIIGPVRTQAPSLQLMKSVTEAKSETTKASSLLDVAQRNAARAAHAYNKARQSVRKAQQAIQKAEQTIQQAQQLQTQATSAVNQIKQAGRNLQEMAATLEPPVDIADAQAAARRARFSMSNLTTATAPIANLAASKRG